MKGDKWPGFGKSRPEGKGEPGGRKEPGSGIPPFYRLPLWNILLMLILLWIWQDAISNYTVKTLPYSEFKEHVRKGEVIQATVSPDRIEGKIQLKPSGTNATAQAATAARPSAPGAGSVEPPCTTPC